MEVQPEIARQLTAAIAAHGQWKVQLADAIESGTMELDPSTVRRDDACPFGQWLHQQTDKRVTSDGHWESTIGIHAQVHSAAASLVTMAKGGKKAEAVAAMGLGQSFSKLTSQLTREVLAWRDGK
jgi:hypothetical protein